MKKILFTLLFIFSLTTINYASTFDYIDVDVYIKEDGSADVKQKWGGNYNDGTEVYIPTIVDDYELQNFKVKEDGVELVNLGTNWDVNASREQKAGKCGLNKVSDGYEMCCGIDKYGTHEFEFSYTISSLVKKYNDGSIGFNYGFINDGLNMAKGCPAQIKLHTEKGEIKDGTELVKMWGFGYNGVINAWNPDDEYPKGSIRASTQYFTSNDSFIIVIKFEDTSWFDITKLKQVNKSWSDVEAAAIKGSEFEKTLKEKNYIWERIKTILCVILFFANLILIWFLAIKGRNYLVGLFISIWSSGFITSGIATGFPLISIVGIGVVLLVMFPPALKQLKWEKLFKKINYSRNIPKNEELFMVYKCIAPNKKQLKIKVDNLIASMMMIMIKNGNIEPVKETRTKLLGGVSEEVNLKLVERPIDDIYAKLYDLLKTAAGSDGILQKNEIKRIGLEYTSKVKSLLSIAESQGLDDCKDNELGNPDKIDKLTEKGIEYVSNIIGLKKYFSDFTLLNERDIQEVVNWEGMLIFATLLDEATKVMNRLKIMYPETPEIQNYVNTIHICNDFNSSLNAGISLHQKQEQAKAAMKAARGGGGSSSHSGGGGHSGGGHGGGTR